MEKDKDIFQKSPLREKVRLFPGEPGVYLMKDITGKVIYVGKAANLRSRVSSYFNKNSGPRQEMLVSRIKDVDYILTGTEIEALITENRLIKEYQPKYNVSLKDDKSYPYLKITAEMYPRLELVRLPEKEDPRNTDYSSYKAFYYGPYTEVRAVRNILRFLGKLFPLHTCRQLLDGDVRGRPCLNYQMKLCLAPCRGKEAVTYEEYGNLIGQVKLFIEGRQRDLQKKLKEEMGEAAARMDFEKAALCRDRLTYLQKIIENQKITAMPEGDCDVIALIRLSFGSDNETLKSEDKAEKGEQISVYIYRIREGWLKERELFPLGGVFNLADKDIIAGFIKNFYGRGGFFPAEIVISKDLDEKELLEEWLSAQAGKKVHFTFPRRGIRRELLERCYQEGFLLAGEKYQRSQRIEREKLQEAKDALDGLKTITGIVDIKRIEGYDISHLRGGEAVGSMVVFHDGFPFKGGYRRFRIREQLNGDDLLAMKEILRRRLSNKEMPLPDLILADGGPGQLNALTDLLEEEKISLPVIALAKKNEEVYLPGRKEPLSLPGDSPSLYLLRRIRDESHRFALTYHRHIRAKEAPISALDNIPGIGAKRKKALLLHFRGVAGIFRAAPEELAEVPGISESLSQLIYDHLHL